MRLVDTVLNAPINRPNGFCVVGFVGAVREPPAQENRMDWMIVGRGKPPVAALIQVRGSDLLRTLPCVLSIIKNRMNHNSFMFYSVKK